MLLCKPANKVADWQHAKEYNTCRDATKLEVIPEAYSVVNSVTSLLGHNEVGHTPNESEVSGNGGDPCEEKSSKRTLTLFLTTQVGDALNNEDHKRNVGEDVGPYDDNHGKEEHTFKLVEIHIRSKRVECHLNEAGVYESTKPDKEPHKHKDDSPIDLQHAIVCIVLVQDGVHKHGEDCTSHRDKAKIKLEADDWRRWNG